MIMAKKRKAKRSTKRKGHSIVVTTSSRVVKTTRMNPRKADKLLSLIRKKWPEFRTDKPISSSEFFDWMQTRFLYAENRHTPTGKLIQREFPGVAKDSNSDVNGNDLIDFVGELLNRGGTKSNPHLSHADARKLFDKYNKAREREDAPTEAQRRARNEATLKRMRKNPDGLLYGSQRLATAMSYWHGGMSDPVYGVSSMWPKHGVTRDRVEDALANMESTLAKFNTPDGRARGGWSAKDGRQLQAIVAGLRKVLGKTQSNPSAITALYRRWNQIYETTRDPKKRTMAARIMLSIQKRAKRAHFDIARDNPVRSLIVPRKMWRKLRISDRRTKNGHRYVRCKTRRARRAFWLPCTIR
jgi:hypothetical protein